MTMPRGTRAVKVFAPIDSADASPERAWARGPIWMPARYRAVREVAAASARAACSRQQTGHRGRSARPASGNDAGGAQFPRQLPVGCVGPPGFGGEPPRCNAAVTWWAQTEVGVDGRPRRRVVGAPRRSSRLGTRTGSGSGVAAPAGFSSTSSAPLILRRASSTAPTPANQVGCRRSLNSTAPAMLRAQVRGQSRGTPSGSLT